MPPTRALQQVASAVMEDIKAAILREGLAEEGMEAIAKQLKVIASHPDVPKLKEDDVHGVTLCMGPGALLGYSIVNASEGRFAAQPIDVQPTTARCHRGFLVCYIVSGSWGQRRYERRLNDLDRSSHAIIRLVNEKVYREGDWLYFNPFELHNDFLVGEGEPCLLLSFLAPSVGNVKFDLATGRPVADPMVTPPE